MLDSPTMDMGAIVSVVAALAVAVVAAATDIRKGKVYNWLTAPAMLAGLALNTALNGADGAKLSFFGLALGFAIWVVQPILGRPLGGGDVKLLMAIGAFTGPRVLLWVGLFSCVWAGVIAAAVALSRGKLWASLKATVGHIYRRAVLRSAEDLQTQVERARVPFAAAAVLGIATALFVPGTLGPV